MTPEDLITLTTARTVQRMDVPGTAKPYWTVAEAGQACAGLEPEIFAALLFSYAGADDVRTKLEAALEAFGNDMRKAEAWSATVPDIDGNRVDYMAPLARICLAEERHPWRFREKDGEIPPGRHQATMSPFYLAMARVSGITWAKRLEFPYATMRWRYITWLSIGRAHMKRWMRREQFYRDRVVGAA